MMQHRVGQLGNAVDQMSQRNAIQGIQIMASKAKAHGLLFVYGQLGQFLVRVAGSYDLEFVMKRMTVETSVANHLLEKVHVLRTVDLIKE